MNRERRHWVLAASVATAASAAGAGYALWRGRESRIALHSSVEEELWAASFDRPDGGRLHMSAVRGQPLVLNFWATWCPPCVREMPALDRFQRSFSDRGWRVLGLAADKPGPVRDFLAHSPVSYPIGLIGFEGIELSRRLGNLSGGLPFTVLFGRTGALLQRRIGETSYELLANWANGAG